MCVQVFGFWSNLTLIISLTPETALMIQSDRCMGGNSIMQLHHHVYHDQYTVALLMSRIFVFIFFKVAGCVDVMLIFIYVNLPVAALSAFLLLCHSYNFFIPF